MNKEIAEKILHILETQRFADWYMGKFDRYIVVDYPKGDPRHVSKEQVVEDVRQMFDSINR